MKKLPIGIQSFSDLRSNDYLYVDKTEIIYHLVTFGKIYFLSRPRCFGKSLLVSTLDALFNGQKELFEGLYIYDKCLETLLATVPNELKMYCEAHYHALVLVWLRFLGFEVHAEVS